MLTGDCGESGKGEEGGDTGGIKIPWSDGGGDSGESGISDSISDDSWLLTSGTGTSWKVTLKSGSSV